jgi:hypothetical protein
MVFYESLKRPMITGIVPKDKQDLNLIIKLLVCVKIYTYVLNGDTVGLKCVSVYSGEG